MFERSFLWAMRHGSRLMFAGSVAMLLAGVVSLVLGLLSGPEWGPGLYGLLYGYLAPAAYLLFGAVLTDRLRNDQDSGQ